MWLRLSRRSSSSSRRVLEEVLGAGGHLALVTLFHILDRQTHNN